MKKRKQLFLNLTLQIDEQVPARDEIEPEKRRVFNQILHGENHLFTNVLADAVGLVLLVKKTLQPLLPYIHRNVGRIQPIPGLDDGPLIDISTKKLDGEPFRSLIQIFLHHHGKGIDLFSRRTAGYPHPEIGIVRQIIQYRRQNIPLQHFKGLAVAKEMSHPDEQLTEQHIHLLRAFPQKFDICFVIFDLVQSHPPLHAPENGAALVCRKIVPHSARENGEYFVEPVLFLRSGSLLRSRDRPLPLIVGAQDVGHLLRRQYLVNDAGFDGACGHAVILRRFGVLRQDEAFVVLDLLHAEASITAGPRQHDADGKPPLVNAERAKQHIHRQDSPVLRGSEELERPFEEVDLAVRRNNIGPVGKDSLPVLGKFDGDRRLPLQQLRHHARLLRVHVDHHDEGHPGPLRHRGKEPLQRLQTARRGTDPYDGKGRPRGCFGLLFPGARMTPLRFAHISLFVLWSFILFAHGDFSKGRSPADSPASPR